MKRFVRYLYEYRDGKRVQNAGFVKVEQSKSATVIQIYGKGFPMSGKQRLEILLFYLAEKQCVGVRQGEITNIRPMTAYRIEYDAKSLGSQDVYDDIAGMILRCNLAEGIRCYAAIWDEQNVDVEQMILQEEWERTQEIVEVMSEEPDEQNAHDVETKNEENEKSVYKITRKDLVNLPRQEWKIANNHFLVHGCRNFHHLVSFEKDGTCWLGVPGIYHKKEEQVARAFGFGQFMKPDEGEIIWEEEEKAEYEEFGYWCRPVHNVIKG